MLKPIPVFDPRDVPVVHGLAGDGLLAPAAHRLTPQGLRQLFASPPEWTPELLREKKFADRAPAQAAVLLPLVIREQLMLILTQRTLHLSTHSGQIALPGGKLDAADASATAAALRETHEEIGLPPERVEVLGTLPVYITGTAFTVTPVVGLVQPGFALQPNPHEVDDVFEVPLAYLMNPQHHRRHAWTYEGVVREWYSMPYQDGAHERFIWGATAGMLRNFYRMLIA
ncbi:MAG: CoA pyrophosphatase [Hydrogenophaga sp.]|uniref:CoA pyrophosphatase n=1 Tax=Hydrogenophaga sp. TaxID=1904254 RepID=UPI0027534831|nr:CoA pyrophosphatase [Hydrogenophaga sp.]MDP2416427.1 CoA pyrophosphatase [Hydrogenophaga sp.]MDZ4187327.1 CoA pyrophosphatase [Hydrogenophaga sp.]